MEEILKNIQCVDGYVWSFFVCQKQVINNLQFVEGYLV